MKKFIMYGAGNIGRGFIGQAFSDAGYQVGFIDINMEVINQLNTDKSYPVHIVTSDANTEKTVKNVYGIDGRDIELVSTEIASCDMMATAIGVNVLKFIAKPIAMGIKKRATESGKSLDIIVCENMIGADNYLKGLILKEIPEFTDFVNKKVGFVEPSIGRMVPVMTDEKKAGNALRVYVEPYNVLPVDKDAFKGEIPKEVTNLYPFAPFNLFIQRKLFMHNMSHAICAYLGYLRNYEYIYQAAENFDIEFTAYKALMSSALAVSKDNGTDIKMLIDHADNLLYRFKNHALADTVARVGKDTQRKLGPNDRLIGSLKLCEKYGIDGSYICIGIGAGLLFNPEGDDSSIELSNFVKENGVIKTLKKYSEYEGKYVSLIENIYNDFKNGAKLNQVIDKVNEINNKEIRV